MAPQPDLPQASILAAQSPGLTPRSRIAHVLRRAGFGGSPAEIDAYTALGFDAAVDSLVDYERVPNDEVEARVAAMEAELDLRRLPNVQSIWLYRILHTRRPVEEKMTLFWHDNFATANYKVGRPQAMHAQNRLFRSQALGSFRQLLYGVSRDPAMLRWLDSNSNRKASPNENYARELMELFTMGVGNYTEQDVQEAARAFTGWFMNRDLQFVFNRNQHDFGEKTFLGRTGPWDGDDVVNIILEQPVTAQHIVGKLFAFFVHDHPAPARVAELAQLFRTTDYNVRELVRAILRSPEFSSPDAHRALVKSPVEHLAGTLKLLGMTEYPRETVGVLRRMGMELYNPPDVSGWDWGTDWITAATLLERLNFANTVATLRGANSNGLDPTVLLRRFGIHTPQQLVTKLVDLLVDGDVDQATREALLRYANNGYSGKAEDFFGDPARADRTVRGVAHLIMAAPVYQLA